MAAHQGDANPPDILGLMRQLDEMPAKRVVTEWNSLQVSLYVYGRNYQEISAFADHLINDVSNEDVWNGQARRKFERVHHETARLLQNHVAAVESLLEHTDQIHRRLYAPQHKMQSYAAQKQQLRNDPLVSFVKCMRNILLHGETAKMTFRTEFASGQLSHTLALDRAFLDKHSMWWKGAAKQYSRSVVDHVDIPRLLRDYDSRIVAFMEWFAKEMVTVSRDELQAFADKERELFLTQIGHFLDCWLRNPDPSSQLAGERTLFSGLFDEEDFLQLEQCPVGTAARAEKAVELLAARFDVPDDLRNKLTRVYLDKNFFRPYEAS